MKIMDTFSLANNTNKASLENCSYANSSNCTHGFEYVSPLNNDVTVVFGSFLAACLVIGITLNLINIIVIARTQELHHQAYFLILLSLSLSDVLSAFVSPLFWYKQTIGYDFFKLDNAFCVIYFWFDTMTSYITSLHVLFLTIYRLIFIRFPKKAGKNLDKAVKIYIVVAWILSFGVTGLTLIFIEARVPNRNEYSLAACAVAEGHTAALQIYLGVTYTLFYYVPLFGIITMTTLIVSTVKGNFEIVHQRKLVSESKIKRRKQKVKNVMTSLLAVVTGYMIGYLPSTVFIMYALATSSNLSNVQNLYRFAVVQYSCLRLSETLNPILYLSSSKQLRDNLKKHLVCKSVKMQPNPRKRKVYVIQSSSTQTQTVY